MSSMRGITQFVKNSSAFFGLNLSYTVSTDQLDRFFKLIRPVSTEYSLLRVGGNVDGGYLVPNDLDGLGACYSPGVGRVADFELDMAERGISSFLADYSVDGPPVAHPLFTFEKKFLGIHDDEKFMTLQTWMSHTSPDSDSDFMLQMDIEGAEYDVIFQTPQELFKRFRVMVIEFHNLDHLLERCGFQLIHASFAKILKDFDIVHVHPNNCSKVRKYNQYRIPPIMEFTFHRKDRITQRVPNQRFPNELDRPCTRRFKDFALPTCWYMGK